MAVPVPTGPTTIEKRRGDLISRLKYTNTLPEIPFDPKLIEISIELDS